MLFSDMVQPEINPDNGNILNSAFKLERKPLFISLQLHPKIFSTW